MLKEGVILGERYEIISRIGSGGMADVYKAKDHKLNRMVAVKVLKPEFREDKTFIRKFRTEAQAAAGLSHPNIVNVFEKGEVDQIYLNFSDPWPKDRHAKRRLTSRQFLECYHNILKEEGRVIFKTDNRPLFDFSLEEVKEAGWTLEKSTFDLHHSEYVEGNIMTEYEEKFVAKGNPICMLQIFLQENK